MMLPTKFFVVILCILVLSAGCGTTQKARRADELELENIDLRAKFSDLELQKDEELKKLQMEKEEQKRALESEIDALKEETARRAQALEREKAEALAALDEEKEAAQVELEEAKRNLERALSKEIEEYKAKLEMTERGLVVTFLSEIFFDSGKNIIKEEGYSTLDSVAKVLVENVPDSPVAVEGHTDNEPIKYSGWYSNWELSSARALAVLHYFIDKHKIAPERLSSVGYGEYRLVASNETVEGKQKNRRVEVVILPKSVVKVKSESAIPEEVVLPEK